MRCDAITLVGWLVSKLTTDFKKIDFIVKNFDGKIHNKPDFVDVKMCDFDFAVPKYIQTGANYHLRIATTILGFSFQCLLYKGTSEQRSPVSNGRNLVVPRVVV